MEDEWYYSVVVCGPKGKYESKKKGPFFEDDLLDLMSDDVSEARDTLKDIKPSVKNRCGDNGCGRNWISL